MAKQPDTDAFVFVEKAWFESTLRDLLGKPRSDSTALVHLLIGPIKDPHDPKGLWMTGIKTTRLRNDGGTTTMDFLIPWRFIVGYGTTDSAAAPAGFSGHDVTMLKP